MVGGVWSPGRHGLRTRLSSLNFDPARWSLRAGSDPIIKQRAIAGPVPWVIAIMTALTVIAAAGGLALGSIAAAAGQELAGGVTVQIAGPPEAEAARQAQAVVNALSGSDGVETLRRLPPGERAALIEPWLGELGLDESGADGGADDSLLVLPELIEVQLSGPADPAALDGLRARIAGTAPDALVNADTGWLAPVGQAIEAMQWLALALVGLLALATLAAVLLASRSALAANRDIIELMHLLGAADRQVAQLFQRAAMVGAGIGGAAGFVVAVVVIAGLGGRFTALGPGAAGEAAGGLHPLHWLLLALIPAMATALAAVTARLTVLATLRRMV